MNIYEIIIFIIGIGLVVTSILNQTKNIVSAVLLKVFPFFSGLYLMVYALLVSGFISIN